MPSWPCGTCFKESASFGGLVIVGMPLVVDQQVFNSAVAFQGGSLLGVVPKTYLPNYKEFYEARWFAPGTRARSQTLSLLGQAVPFGTDLLFDGQAALPGLVVGIEICEDLWVPIPPSQYQAVAGATVLFNLSASNEIIGKAGYRRQMVGDQSGRCIAGYVYASCGPDESTTDLVFGGHALSPRTAPCSRRRSVSAREYAAQRRPRYRTHGQRPAEDDELLSRPTSRRSNGSWRRIPFNAGRRCVAAPADAERRSASVRARGAGSAGRALPGHLSHAGRRPGEAAGAHRQAAR